MSDYHEAHTSSPILPHDSLAGHRRTSGAVVSPDASVVEIGAGYCDWINHVRAPRRLAVDIWPGVARFAAAGVDTAVRDAADGLRSLGEASFDNVLASNVLEHFSADVAASIVGDIAGHSQAGRAPHRHSAELQVRMARLLRRLHAPGRLHRRLDGCAAQIPRLTIEHVEPRFVPYSMKGARLRPRPMADPRLPSLALQARRRPNARRRTQGLS
jgi:hypothetical protein